MAVAKKEKAIVKIQLSNLVSTSDFQGSVREVDRFTVKEGADAGFEYGKIFLSKPSTYTNDKGETVQGVGGLPMAFITLPADIAAKYDIDQEKPDILMSFHSSGKEILAETGNKWSLRLDIVEIEREDETHAFLFTATGAQLTGKIAIDQFVA